MKNHTIKHQGQLAKEHWQAFNEEEIFSELNTSENGLNQEEVKKRLEFYGENKLPESGVGFCPGG